MPSLIVPLRNHDAILLRLGVEPAVLLGADGANLRIVAAQLTLRVENGVDVERGRGRPTC